MHCHECAVRLRPAGPPASAIRERFNRIFPGSKVDLLAPLCEAVAAQKHGAMLVITPSAAVKAGRLATQSRVIEPFSLTEELIPSPPRLTERFSSTSTAPAMPSA
jgi:hypothetical protein